jgi:TRAP-type mannitol/chloroaromatic compound transport system permease large subunit
MIPSIVLIFLVLGTIFLGIATPTEAGASAQWAPSSSPRCTSA